MKPKSNTQTTDGWLARLFGSAPAQDGGVFQHPVQDVEARVGREAFLREVEQRGYQVVENGRQFVVFCNHAAIQRVWSRAFTATR